MLTNSLYYPSILVPNDIWLRKAILYWDSINPIAPRIISEQIPEKSVSKILEKEGLLKFIHPERLLEGGFGNALTDEFVRLIKSEQIQRRLPREESRIFQMRIHVDKFNDGMISSLRDANIYKENPNDRNWLLFEMNAGLIYMGFLATELSKRLGMEPITDKSQFSDLFLLSQFQPSVQKSNLLSLSLDKLLPAPKKNVDINKVIKFRKTNEAELLSFRSAIRVIVSELNEIESEDQINATLAKYKDEIKAECIAIKRKLKENRIETILDSLDTIFNIKQPEIISSIGISAISVELALAALGTNAVIKVGSKIFNGVKRRNNVFDSYQYSYVYKINNELR